MRRFVGAMRHQLRHHVDAAVEHIAQRMGVVRRDVMLLRIGRAEPLARFEKKLIDHDIRRHLAVVDRRRVSERRIAGEQPLRDRIEKTPLQLALGARRFERQRGEDGEIDRAVGGRLGVERVGDVIGLAETERQSEHDGLANLLDNRVREPHRIGKARRPRAGMDHCKESQPGSGWKRGPYFCARLLSVSRTSAMPRVRP